MLCAARPLCLVRRLTAAACGCFAATVMEVPLTGDSKYEETNELLQEVVALFSAKEDVASIREAGRSLTELHAAGEARHKEMLESIKGMHSSSRSRGSATCRCTPKVRTALHMLVACTPALAALTALGQRQKQEFEERQATLLDPTQKQQLLAERTRVEDNIKRLNQVPISTNVAQPQPHAHARASA